MTFPWIVAGVASVTALALGWVLARAAARKAPEPPGRPAPLHVVRDGQDGTDGAGPLGGKGGPGGRAGRVFIAPVGADPRDPDAWRELGEAGPLDVDRMHDDWNGPW